MVGVSVHLSCGRFQDYDVEEDGIIYRSTTQLETSLMTDLSGSSTHKLMQSRSIGN